MSILIVDDEKIMLKALSDTLELKGFEVLRASDGMKALEILKNTEKNPSVIISDMKMPKMDGLQLLEKVKENYPYIVFIVMTAFGTVETAVNSMKKGAFDYITKPFSFDEIEITVNRAIEHYKLKEENIQLKKKLKQRYSFQNIIGKNHKMHKIYDLIEKVAPSSASILITGESGTGKELVANAIHYSSDRAGKPFLKVNCSALPETLLETELFGHVKGAFTGAVKDSIGRFESADGGTIFLDEIGEISTAIQVKLLRVIQERTFERIGETKTRKVDVRIIAATNQDLLELVDENKFREDLYYRLNVIELNLPPLRERKDDIPFLSDHFLKKYSHEAKKPIEGFEQEVMKIFLNYNWPGNIRELENTIHRAIVLETNKKITKDVLPHFRTKSISENGDESLEEIEKQHILDMLAKYDYNYMKTSKALKIDRKTLYNKMKKYELK